MSTKLFLLLLLGLYMPTVYAVGKQDEHSKTSLSNKEKKLQHKDSLTAVIVDSPQLTFTAPSTGGNSSLCLAAIPMATTCMACIVCCGVLVTCSVLLWVFLHPNPR